MNIERLLSRLKGLNRTIIIIGPIVIFYLLIASAETQSVRNRKEKLAEIDAYTDLALLKGHASGLAMVANNAGAASKVLLGISMLTVFLFVVLALVSLAALHKLSTSLEEKSSATPSTPD